MEQEVFDIIKAVNKLADRVIENTGKVDALLASFTQLPSRELNNQYVNEDTASAILHRCPNTLLRLRRNGELPYLKVGKKVLYKLSDLKGFLEENYRK
jgi:hypothetical protein